MKTYTVHVLKLAVYEAKLKEFLQKYSGRIKPSVQPPDLSTFCAFTSRDEYQTWRCAWVHLLNNVIQRCIAARSLRKDRDPAIRALNQARREQARVQAFNLLLLRKDSKLIAGAQYHQQRLADQCNQPGVRVERSGDVAVG